MKSREDWLCDQLDRNDLSLTQRTKYEDELDKLADSFSIMQAKREAYANAERARRAQIAADLKAQGFGHSAIDMVINTVGEEEFGTDYEVIQEGNDHVVYSRVAREDQTDRRVWPTLDKALHDRRYLIYNRLYDRYVRTKSVDGMSQIYS